MTEIFNDAWITFNNTVRTPFYPFRRFLRGFLPPFQYACKAVATARLRCPAQRQLGAAGRRRGSRWGRHGPGDRGRQRGWQCPTAAGHRAANRRLLSQPGQRLPAGGRAAAGRAGWGGPREAASPGGARHFPALAHRGETLPPARPGPR